ncbi:YgiT-type zinc finger protein [bacterium]|nr:YgiT-type zinc finger protein [bacterium]
MRDNSLQIRPQPATDVGIVFHGCPSCGAGPLQSRTISSILWQGDKAVMVRGVPVTICAACGEDIISEATARDLHRITGAAYGTFSSAKHVSIPVLEFGKIASSSST